MQLMQFACTNLSLVCIQAILGTSDMLCTCERVATGEVQGSATCGEGLAGNGRDNCRLAGRCLYQAVKPTFRRSTWLN